MEDESGTGTFTLRSHFTLITALRTNTYVISDGNWLHKNNINNLTIIITNNLKKNQLLFNPIQNMTN